MEAYFLSLVAAWEALPPKGAAIIVEDSPWAYLTKHASHLLASKRADLRSLLAPLTLPTLTFILHSSGRAIGRRHALHRTDPDTHAPTALF